METAAHAQGRPSWAELMTTDADAAIKFYGDLFGWTDSPQPIPESDEPYHMQLLKDAPVGAIGKLGPEQAAMGMPRHGASTSPSTTSTPPSRRSRVPEVR